jgi:hypothetical protein
VKSKAIAREAGVIALKDYINLHPTLPFNFFLLRPFFRRAAFQPLSKRVPAFCHLPRTFSIINRRARVTVKKHK